MTAILWKYSYFISYYKIIIIIMVGNARLGDSDRHPISSNTPAPQNRPIERKKIKWKWGEPVKIIKKTLALLLKPASPTQSNAGSARS